MGLTIEERKIRWRLEAETEIWVQKLATTHHALARVVAEQHAIDLVEIDLAPDDRLCHTADVGCLNGAADPLRRTRVGGKYVELIATAAVPGNTPFDFAVGAHLG